jgi:tetratricopeptide (TPR) repeat protein
MKQWFFVICLCAMLAMAGCSGQGDEPDAETQVAPALEVAEYTDARSALTDGIAALEVGDLERAIELFNKAVELDPDLAEAYFRLGLAYALVEYRDRIDPEGEELTFPGDDKPDEEKPESVKAFEKAVEAYKRLIEKDSENHVSHFNLGRALNKLDKDEEAARALRQAVKLNPDDSEYQVELGSVLMKLAKYREAELALKKAVEIDPLNSQAEELLERAEAGRKRIDFVQLPKDESKTDRSANENTEAEPVRTDISTPDPKAPKPPAPANKSSGNLLQ